MKTKKLLFIVTIFVLGFTAACGGTATPVQPVDAPVEAPAEAPVVEEPAAEAPAEESAVEAPAEAPASVTTEFPLPEDASNLTDIGNGAFNFQTALSIPDVVTFYRFAFPEYTEREAVTVVEDTSFSIVFDGHASGQAIVIQGFSVDGGINVSIRLEAQ